jgi:hypothetical protein
MYVIPLVIVILIALVATAWTPIFALIIALPLFLAFLGYVGMRRRADQTIATPTPGPEATGATESDTPKGAWGEPRP